MKKVYLFLVAVMLFATSCNNETIDDNPTMEQTFKSDNDKGYDQWGYNYQANMFNGFYDNYSRPAVPVTSGVRLMMKWNDAWLDENKVRHEGFPTYRGSGAWLTNHEQGDDYTYFVKIIAPPLDATVVDGVWVLDGVEIGPVIWGQFAIIQEQATGNYDLENYRNKFKNGLGNW